MIIILFFVDDFNIFAIKILAIGIIFFVVLSFFNENNIQHKIKNSSSSKFQAILLNILAFLFVFFLMWIMLSLTDNETLQRIHDLP